MPWLKIDIDLEGHPKTKKLAKALNLSTREARNLLIDLWAWARKYAETGYLGRWHPEEVADGINWHGDPGMLFLALMKTKWIDRGWLNDWHEWGGSEVMERVRKQGGIPEKYREFIAFYISKTWLPAQNCAELRTERGEREKERDINGGVLAHETDTIFQMWLTQMSQAGVQHQEELKFETPKTLQ